MALDDLSPPTRQFTLYLPPGERVQLEAVAEREGKSLSGLIRELCREGLEARENANKKAA